jgi:hypothetical protein
VARKYLQNLKIYVALFSEAHLNPHMRFHIPNYDICPADPQDGHKGGTAAAVKKCVAYTCVDLSPVLSIEPTGVCVPIGHTEMVLSAVHKYPQIVWINTELLRFRNKPILADDLKTEHPVWNSKISNFSDLKHLELCVSYNFEISVPQCSTHYTPDGRSDVLFIVVH